LFKLGDDLALASYMALAASLHTSLTQTTSTGAPPAMSIAFSKARSQPTCPCKRRPSTSWLINLKAAKMLGLSVPQCVISRADETR
jgi:hypothetical protein